MAPGDTPPAAQNDAEALFLASGEAGVRDAAGEGMQPSPPPARPLRVGTSCLACLLFGWATPLLQRGSTQAQLQQHDLFQLPASLEPAACGRRLWGGWREEQQADPPPSLLWALVRAWGWQYAALGLLKAASDALNFAGPMLLSLLLQHLSSGRSSAGGGSANSQPAVVVPELRWGVDRAAPWFGYGCAGLLAASLVLKALLGGQYSYHQGVISNQLRAAITSTVFRKVLLVNSASLAAIGTGMGAGAVNFSRAAGMLAVRGACVVGPVMQTLGLHESWNMASIIWVGDLLRLAAPQAVCRR